MLRELALSGLGWAGVAVDPAANDLAVRGRSGEVQASGSRVKVRALWCCGDVCKGHVCAFCCAAMTCTIGLPPH